MKITKLLAALVGVPMILGSLALTAAGAFALAIPDDDGWVSVGPVRMTTDAVALVGEDIEIDLGDRIADGNTKISWEAIAARLEVESRGDRDVFVGIANDDDARAYLDGIATARVTSFDDDPELRYRDGTDTVAPPVEQDFWVASAVDGTSLEWDVTDGDWAIIILNADGTSGVDAAVTGSAKIPFLAGIGVALIIAGIAGTATGTMLTYYGVRRVRTRADTSAPPPPAEPVAAT